MNQADDKYISTADLMDMLGLSRATVDRLRDRGMPALRIGAVWRYPADGVLKWLEERQARSEREGG